MKPTRVEDIEIFSLAAGAIKERNDRWSSGWESVNQKLSRVQ